MRRMACTWEGDITVCTYAKTEQARIQQIKQAARVQPRGKQRRREKTSGKEPRRQGKYGDCNAGQTTNQLQLPIDGLPRTSPRQRRTSCSPTRTQAHTCARCAALRLRPCLALPGLGLNLRGLDFRPCYHRPTGYRRTGSPPSFIIVLHPLLLLLLHAASLLLHHHSRHHSVSHTHSL